MIRNKFYFKDLKNEETPEPQQSNTRNSPAKSKKPSNLGTKKTPVPSTVGNREDSAAAEAVTEGTSAGAKRKLFQKRPSNKSQNNDGESKTPNKEPTNVNMNKRALDPKLGPIKKIAATRQLPKIDR